MFLECNIKRFRATQQSEVSRSFEGTSNGGVGSSTSSKQKQSPEVKYNKMLQIPIETTGPPTKINKISTHRVVVSVLGGVIQKHRKGGKQWKRPMFWQTKQKSTVCCGAYQSQSGFAFLTALFCVARRFGVAFSPLPQCFPAPTMKVYEGGEAKFADVELRGKEQYYLVCFSSGRWGKT